MIYSDRSLSQKLERTEARSNADFVETRARLDRASEAEWFELAGAYVMFDAAGSPLTQTFGLWLFEDITEKELDEIEGFYKERDAAVIHEISPMSDPSHMEILTSRGYSPVELTSVMILPLDRETATVRSADSKVTTRIIEPDEVELWARTASRGWSTEMPGMEDFMFDFCQIGAQCRGAYPYIAEIDGTVISTAAFLMYDGVAMLAGASTVPEARNRGGQTALLAARLQFARDSGCSLAIMGANPGSQSQINGQKNGFQIAYTRTKWQLAAVAG